MKALKVFRLVVAVLLVVAVRAYADDNSIITPPPPDSIFYPAIQPGKITIMEGWNLIAMPVIPLVPYTVDRFIADVETSIVPIDPPYIVRPDQDQDFHPRNEWNVPVVAVYKNGRFEKYPKEGMVYNMVPGEAYFVYAVYNGVRPMDSAIPESPIDWRPSKTIAIKGRLIHHPVTLNLNRGWTGASIMVPVKPYNIIEPLPKPEPGPILYDEVSVEDPANEYLPDGIYPYPYPKPRSLGMDLRTLSNELCAQGIKAKRIIFWSAVNQSWEQHELPFTEKSMLLRFIRPDEGFFLLCGVNGLYIPNLSSDRDGTIIPTFPSFPPDLREVE